jgi:prevent-host-death family protein
MKKINALKFRQSFGAILDDLAKKQEALVIERSSKPVAVLISYEEFKRRFVDKFAENLKQEIISQFKKNSIKSKENTTQILRKIRYGNNS